MLRGGTGVAHGAGLSLRAPLPPRIAGEARALPTAAALRLFLASVLGLQPVAAQEAGPPAAPPAAPTASAIAQEPAAGPQVFVAPKRRALVVGAGAYEHLGRLRYANGDAKAFAAALTGGLGFDKRSVRLLTDDAPDEELTPTAGHLFGELEALLADPRRNASDLFIFYFSGHGVGLPDGDYLMPTDARRESAARVGIPVREVIERFARSGARNVLIIVDACREGEANAFGSELFRLADAARLAVVLSCEPGTRSYEDPALGRGVFTAELLRALDDPALRDAATGARWASRVAAAAAAGVRAWSAGRTPPQTPVIWTDPARDVLLDAAIPAAGPSDFFGASSERLDPPAFLAALAAYAGALHAAGRHVECVDLLKASEQIAPLPAEHAFLLASALMQLGRRAEAARTLADVRAAAPDSLPALVATVSDWSGATPPAERAAAARALWDSGASLPADLIVMMVQAHAQGGAAADALALAREAFQQTPDFSREEAYLAAIVAMLEPSDLDPEELFALAEARPGAFPGDQDVRLDRVLYAHGRHGIAGSLPLLDDAVARWPEQGAWLAMRAWQRRVAAPTVFDLQPAFDDARAALAKPLDPGSLWLAVRAAGARAPELHAEVTARAREHPLSWQAQLVETFARQPEDLKEEVERVARLSPRPALVYAAMARLTLDAVLERGEFFLRAELTAEQREQLQFELVAAIRSLYERLTPMAPEFGGDPEAWGLLQDLSQRLLQYEAFVRIFEREFAAEIDAGRLAESLVPVYARALLNTGRLERFRQVARSMLRDSVDADALIWQEALYLACAGREAEALEVIGARAEPKSRAWTGLGAGLRALAAARAGRADEARALLPAAGPNGAAGFALQALILRALGDHEPAERLTLLVEDLNSAESFYATLACLDARPGADPRWEASRASEFQPGNPLVARHSYLGRADLTAFVGSYSFTIEFASGGMEVSTGSLQFTVLPDGRVLGAVLAPSGEACVVQGSVDAYGNLEAQVTRPAGALTLLAKLAPRPLQREYAHLLQAGQHLTVIGTDGLPHLWVLRLQE